MAKQLSGVKVAIVVADGFEQVEMTEPNNALRAQGAETEPRQASTRKEGSFVRA